MNIGLALRYAQLVQAAYLYHLVDPTLASPEALPNTYDVDSLGYQIVAAISAIDLKTDLNWLFPHPRVQIGYVLQDDNGDAVVAIRGTEGIFEWVSDILFSQLPCPFKGGAGQTEDGFTDMYTSLQLGMSGAGPALITGLPKVAWRQSPKSLTICGHSLGSSLATLLAYDVAVNSTITAFKPPVVYTFASPRTGDAVFALNYDDAVPSTFRVANDVDIVPHLPMEVPFGQVPLYHHVGSLNRLIPFGPTPTCTNLLQRSVKCHHILSSYLNLMDNNNALDPQCVVS